MDLKAFSVVYFPSDNSIEVVPSSWLSTDQGTCPFPTIQGKGFKDLQQNPNSTPDTAWPVWNVEVKKTYGNS